MTPKLLASSSAPTVGPIAPPPATTSGADANSGGAILPSPDFYRATSLLSIGVLVGALETNIFPVS